MGWLWMTSSLPSCFVSRDPCLFIKNHLVVFPIHTEIHTVAMQVLPEASAFSLGPVAVPQRLPKFGVNVLGRVARAMPVDVSARHKKKFLVCEG